MRSFTVTFAGNQIPVNVAESLTDVWDCIHWMDQQPETVFGLDTETTGLDVFDPEFKVRMVQISDGDTAWLLPVGLNKFMDDTIVDVFSMQGPGFRFATHTAYDSLAIWKQWGVVLGQRVVDTHLLACLALPAEKEERGLKPLSTQWLNGPELADTADRLHARFKEMAIEAGEKQMARSPKKLIGWGLANVGLDEPLFEEYAALDAIAVSWLAPALVKSLGTGRNLIGIEMWLGALTTSMRVQGMKVDTERVHLYLEQAKGEIEEAEAVIKEATGLASARSPKRVDWLLSKGVKFDPTATTDSGGPSLAKEFLPPLVAAYPEHTEVGMVLRAIHVIAERSNLVTNLENFLKYSDAEGRVHPEIKTLQARTARMSVTNPPMQTLSKTDPRLRGCLIADEGMSLVSVDFSQVEARVAAALSGDPVLTEVILSGEDLHSSTAKAIFGDGFTEEQRSDAKMANFQSLFGGGWKALAQTGIPEDKAKMINKQWRKTYQGVTDFGYNLSQRKVVKTPTGRNLPVDPEAPYAALNYMIQSTARDLLVIAVYRIIHRLGIPPKAIWLLVHDEVLLQVPEDIAESVASEVEKIMGTTLYGIPITAEAEVLGKRWGKDA